MKTRLIVVDDFYSDPHAVRAIALRDQFQSAGGYNYPGWQSAKAVHTQTLATTFGKLVGAAVVVDTERFTWGGFRMITAQSGELMKVHADTGVDWAGMVYLTPNAPASAGTGFFRHRETGLIGPPTDAHARELGYEDSAHFERDVARRDMADPDKWVLESFVGPVFNRLVLFRGCEFYHAPLAGFGSSRETARLTHNFFFNQAPAREPYLVSVP